MALVTTGKRSALPSSSAKVWTTIDFHPVYRVKRKLNVKKKNNAENRTKSLTDAGSYKGVYCF